MGKDNNVLFKFVFFNLLNIESDVLKYRGNFKFNLLKSEVSITTETILFVKENIETS